VVSCMDEGYDPAAVVAAYDAASAKEGTK
jgi:hypothetical protein